MRTAGNHCVLRRVLKFIILKKDYKKHDRFYRETGDFLAVEIADEGNESA